MRSFFRTILRRRPTKHDSKSTISPQAKAMSSGMTAAALYAVTMTPPSALGAVPEDTAEKAHHLKNGKGFINPWDSWRDQGGIAIAGAMAW